ncbi:uncharacterized protein MEPE_03472 [Melanopsichium pennsylvanicum]|uniref:Glycosyl transferase CAP10 domain-containing protein n=2 Tax=Melanopsichium pennsylvanicum TaxID=63383 RepID=A0AAJ5C5N9_9BASI|nr:conserved hypothetical protein [Melanopsichium pennsylvanicum 4]SNX84763.1 uncharacterized protein MEPE_03472 [Melanopsichium pennsylvanicum]
MSSDTRYSALPDSETSAQRGQSSPTSPNTTSSNHAALFARASVYCATAFVFTCLLLSILPSSSLSPSLASSSASFSKGLPAENRRDRTMSEATCRTEFPLFFPQLEQNLAAWKAKGGISYTHLDEAARTCATNWGMARVVIRDGQLFLRQVREGGESRTSALLHLLHTAVTSDPSSIPSLASALRKNFNSTTGIELVLSEADKDASASSDAVWVLAKKTSEHASKGTWLLPDFGFASWPEAGIPSFEEYSRLASLQDHLSPWHAKSDRVLWRGLANGYSPRVDLLSRTKVAGAESWADVKQTSFHDKGDEFFPLIPMHQHCRSKYLIQTEGNSYSGRGKYLWSCRSVTISHPLEWTQHFHPALNSNPRSPEQNYVQLPGPLFSGLEETILALQKSADAPTDQDVVYESSTTGRLGGLGRNPPQRIADNAVESLRNRYLTPAATMCYIRAALKAYSQVLNVDTWPRDDTAAAWDQGGVGIVPHGGPGGGVAPGSGKKADLKTLGVKGDIEYGVWRLSGSPDWPPQ